MKKVAKDLLEPTGGIVDMLTGSQMHRENRGNIFKKNTGNLEILPKHRDFCCSSSKFPDSKGKGYYYICHETSILFLEAGYC